MLVAISVKADSFRCFVRFPDAKTKPALMHLLSARAEYLIEEVTLSSAERRVSILLKTLCLHSDRKVEDIDLFNLLDLLLRHCLKVFLPLAQLQRVAFDTL